MPDWGTLISDSKGILHDVALESFDSLSKNVRQPLNTTNKLLTETFDTTWKSFRKRIQGTLGLNPEEGLTLESVSKLGETLKGQAARFGVETVVGYVASKAANLEGPLGILMSEAVTIATTEFSAYFLGKQNFKRGQWVFLDCGTQTRHINDNPTVIQINEENDFFGSGSYAVIPDELDYSTEARHAIGFVLGQEPSGYEWAVFNFLSGKEEKFHDEKIRACPEDFATKLDANPDFSSVREVLFLKDHDPTLKTYIPTEKGQTVWLDKKPYKILEQAGEEWVLEGNDGTHLRVHESDLMPGRTATNTKWNHDTMHLGSYRVSDAIYSGQWVWIPAGDFVQTMIDGKRRRMQAVPAALHRMGPENKILAMVKSVEGEMTHLVRAYDGEPVDVLCKDVIGTSNEVEGLLDHDKDLASWKEMTLDGVSSKFLVPGKFHPMLTLGLGEFDDEELAAAGMAPVTKLPMETADEDITEPIVTDGGAQDKVDARALTDLQDLQQEEQFLYNERPGDIETYTTASSSSSGGSGGMLMVVLAVGIAWSLYA